MKEHESWEAGIVRAVGLPAIPLPVSQLTASGTIFSGRCLLRGWAFENASGAANDFQILDGTDVNGLLVAYIHLSNLNMSTGPVADAPILMRNGVFIVISTPPLRGAVYVTPITGLRGDYQGAP